MTPNTIYQKTVRCSRWRDIERVDVVPINKCDSGGHCGEMSAAFVAKGRLLGETHIVHVRVRIVGVIHN